MMSATTRDQTDQRYKVVFFYAAVTLLALIWFTPIIMLLLTALKSSGDFAINGALAVPQSIEWSNFGEAWDTGVKNYFLNSLIITVIKVPLGVTIEAMAAFALTHMNFRWAGKVEIDQAQRQSTQFVRAQKDLREDEFVPSRNAIKNAE
jgi:ABC-type glycerol-3-phosphate transport system permease component